MMRVTSLICCVGCWVCTNHSLSAAILFETDPTAFAAAISGRTTNSVDFDASPAGTVIASGSTFGGINFTYSWSSGESLRINDLNATNSGVNYLGASNGTGTPVDLIADINNIQLAPSIPFSALGLFVITSANNPPLDGDLRLESGGVAASLTNPPVTTLTPSNDEVFFLGLYDDAGAAIGPVDLVADFAAFGLGYRVDGINYAATVPEPNSLAIGLVLVLAGAFRRRRQLS